MNLKSLLVLCCAFLMASSSYASFGGSRSSGGSSRSYSSSSRSYSSPSRSYNFGGSRSSGQPATIIRKPTPSTPSYSRSYSAPNTVVHNTTVVQQSGGGGMGWLPWLMFWDATRQPQQQPVIINNVPGQQGVVDPNQPMPYQQQPQVIVQQQSSSHWLLWTLFILAVLIGLGWYMISEKVED